MYMYSSQFACTLFYIGFKARLTVIINRYDTSDSSQTNIMMKSNVSILLLLWILWVQERIMRTHSFVELTSFF